MRWWMVALLVLAAVVLVVAGLVYSRHSTRSVLVLRASATGCRIGGESSSLFAQTSFRGGIVCDGAEEGGKGVLLVCMCAEEPTPPRRAEVAFVASTRGCVVVEGGVAAPVACGRGKQLANGDQVFCDCSE